MKHFFPMCYQLLEDYIFKFEFKSALETERWSELSALQELFISHLRLDLTQVELLRSFLLESLNLGLTGKLSAETQPFGLPSLRTTSATSVQPLSAGHMASVGPSVARHLLSRVGRWISGFAGKTSFNIMPNWFINRTLINMLQVNLCIWLS